MDINNWIEVKQGDMAEVGDKVIGEGGEVFFLSQENVKVHNQYEPLGYNCDSYIRYRAST